MSLARTHGVSHTIITESPGFDRKHTNKHAVVVDLEGRPKQHVSPGAVARMDSVFLAAVGVALVSGRAVAPELEPLVGATRHSPCF